ncbi:SchA/CurD-like domain-containing protein [Sphaerisporangium corydalis]|uniref:SchA/CurD-like domain-containing protein n=1 Tax=Sphaerisporangium corydalis TaxID=1441875 RepID=A0ABV9EEI0_9ACTN|nr:SchA/CurD-like domain-containing protein [Sphaerisporangium corydalis]
MAFAAITYRVKPGYEKEIAEIFDPANFKRADTPNVRNDQGGQSARILGTGLFIQDDIMVRAIQYDGELEDVARHMASQRGVREAEERIAPYLAEERDTSSVEGFLSYFRKSTMLCVQQRTIQDVPGAQLAALRYRVKPGFEQEIAKVFSEVQAEARPALRDQAGQEVGLIVAVALFVKDESMIRVVQYDGELDDVARYMAARGGRPDMELKLAPYMDEDRHVETREDFLAQFKKNTMRRISMLSAANRPPAG